MVKCSAVNCTSATYNKTPGTTFHRFPKNEDVKKVWVANMKRKDWQPNSSSVLCSKHFEPHLLDSSIFCTRLRPGAIPTLFPDLPENKENVPEATKIAKKRSAAGQILTEQETNIIEPQPSTSKQSVVSFTTTQTNEENVPEATKVAKKRSAVGQILTEQEINIIEPQPSPSKQSVVSFTTTQTNKENVPEATKVAKKRSAAGQILTEQETNIIEPQPSTSKQSVVSFTTTQTNEENVPEVAKTRSAAGQILTEPETNIIEPQPSTSKQSVVSFTMQTIDEGPCTSQGVKTCTKERKINPHEEIKSLKKKIILKNKKIKALQQKTRRLKTKVSKFSDVINNLKQKLNQDDVHILSGIPVNNKEFFVRYLKKAKSNTLERTYSPEIRSFALQLHFYSPRAYDFVRNSFNTVLPHPGTLSRWYKKVNAEPGFTSESFETLEAISKSSEKKVYVNLSIDEMAIRKGLVWDSSENKYKGYVDTGSDVSDDSLPLATQALVMLITAINFNWSLPIAYFFITSMTGEQRANLVKIAIEMLYKINVFVCGITFDGAASNISMATYLGCDFSLNTMKPYFMYQNMRINAFYDPCHMIKLIRNTLGDFETLTDKDGNIIRFKYLSLLLDLQSVKGLHLANRLKQAHIYFSKQKMKVRLATELLSKSVADALMYCKDNLKLNDFKDCAPTVKFINIMNDAFDVLNSRSTLAPGHKKALCAANIDRVKELFEFTKDYIMNLKLANGKLVVTSARKTGFIGFLVGLQSALNMFEHLIYNEKLRFLPVYKISQDFLEMFFGKMRARGGFNDNPNVVQFKAAYKKNVIRIKIKLQKDGFNIPNAILTVSSTQKTIETVNNTTPSFEKHVMELCNINEDDIDSFLDNIISSPLDEYTDQVTIYIAGFIARKVLKVINCLVCHSLVIGVKENFLCSLINKKDRGGLIYPSDGLIKVIQACEKILKTFKRQINYYSMIIFVSESLNYNTLFISHNEEHDVNHVHLLIKVITKFYVDLRCKHDAKQTGLSDRNYLKKMILFRNK